MSSYLPAPLATASAALQQTRYAVAYLEVSLGVRPKTYGDTTKLRRMVIVAPRREP